jgi:predicted dehydrogenase
MAVKIGVIGIGVVGRIRSRAFARDIEGSELAAVCDLDPAALDWAKQEFGDGVKCFDDAEKMWDSVDAVMIATRHYDHPTLAIRAFEKGKHVCVEKPAGVHPKQVREMNEAAAATGTVFTIHFQQRYKPINQLLHGLIQSGEIGRVQRINWIITTWFRSQQYYNSGGWRATWAGEGGGVLLNQAPHQLDLWHWFFGMPSRVRAFCYEGKYHEMETEDEATIFMEYEDGCTGVFIASTAENPGTNRLEIKGDRGEIIVDGGKICCRRTRYPVQESIKTTKFSSWGGETWPVDLTPSLGDAGPSLDQDFIDAIAKGKETLVPGESGLNEVLLASAALQSAWDDGWVEIANFDDDRYLAQLLAKAQESTFKKGELSTPNFDEGY